jgi:hypothetical protein
MKSLVIIASLLLIVTSISIGPSIFGGNMFAKAQETGNSIISSFNSTNGNVTNGKLIYEGRGEITGQTVLQGPTVQTSFSSNDTISKGSGPNNEKVKEIGTYTSTPRASGILYGEGKGVITGKNNEMVTWTSQQIGTMTPEGKIIFHGSMFFNSLSQVGSLAFLDNMPALFSFEVDSSKNTITKVWELR